MTVSVLSPGVLSSFQDLGRYGCQHLGVPVGGAMDNRAHRLANLLVGNPEDEATLEVTLTGPTLRFNQAACIAISGANLSATINRQAVPNNRPLILRAGDVLAFGPRTTGTRAYIAWHGGISLPVVLGSRSTYLRGQFGGYKGRALKKDDTLTMRYELAPQALDELAAELWKLKVYLPAILGIMPRNAIRVLRGADAKLFTAQSVDDFFNTEYRISANSDRMGYLLNGAKLVLQNSSQLLSEATSFGTIQVPHDGSPIVLMADRQTTGGYAKIAHIATVDLSAVAQYMPGEAIRFNEIELSHAQQLDNQREEAFGRLYQTLTPLRQLLEHYRKERRGHA
jgi:biotin-dependent carboxylase-like uncharacterized protein